MVCLRKEYEHLTDMRVEFFRSNGAFFLMTIMFVQDRRHVAFSCPHELYDFFSITPFLQLKMEAFFIDTLEFLYEASNRILAAFLSRPVLLLVIPASELSF